MNELFFHQSGKVLDSCKSCKLVVVVIFLPDLIKVFDCHADLKSSGRVFLDFSRKLTLFHAFGLTTAIKYGLVIVNVSDGYLHISKGKGLLPMYI